MKHMLALLATTAIIGVSSAAFAVDAKVESDYKAKDNGGYAASSSTERTNASGTAMSHDSKTEVDVDNDGSTTKTVKSKAISDAEGLMNKKKNISETKTTRNADGSYERKSSDEHTDANGTDTSVDTKAKTEVDADGTTHTKAVVTKKVDPKGLFNSKKVESEVEMKNGKVIKKETDK